MMKRFLLDGILFTFFLLVLIFSLEPYLISVFFPEYRELTKVGYNNVDVVVFGSSVNKYYAPQDTDKRSITDMLDNERHDDVIVGISHGGYHLEIFYSFLQKIARLDKKPILVIPINLRSFSPEWNLRPAYQFRREKGLLEFGLFYSFLSKYPGINEITFENTEVAYNEVVGTVKEYEKVTQDTLLEQKKGFVYHYMQPIDENHKKIEALKAIKNLALEKNIKVLFYITPIDYERARELNITGFDRQVDNNILKIKKTLEDKKPALLDLSKFLNHSYFSYYLRPNEHLNMYGKLKVVKEISNELNLMENN